MVVGSKVNQERIGIEFRRPPHRSFRPDDASDISNQRSALPTFVAERVDNNSIFFAIDLKFVVGPVWRDLGRSADHHVPVRELPFTLVRISGPAINYAPTLGRLD